LPHGIIHFTSPLRNALSHFTEQIKLSPGILPELIPDNRDDLIKMGK
jgi:hypothetical protein